MCAIALQCNAICADIFWHCMTITWGEEQSSQPTTGGGCLLFEDAHI